MQIFKNVVYSLILWVGSWAVCFKVFLKFETWVMTLPMTYSDGEVYGLVLLGIIVLSLVGTYIIYVMYTLTRVSIELKCNFREQMALFVYILLGGSSVSKETPKEKEEDINEKMDS